MEGTNQQLDCSVCNNILSLNQVHKACSKEIDNNLCAGHANKLLRLIRIKEAE